jgi:hypothetical protein
MPWGKTSRFGGFFVCCNVVLLGQGAGWVRMRKASTSHARTHAVLSTTHARKTSTSHARTHAVLSTTHARVSAMLATAMLAKHRPTNRAHGSRGFCVCFWGGGVDKPVYMWTS